MSQPQRDVALITGATGNLGRALAQVVQEESMPCILLDRNADKLRTLYGEDTNDRRIVAADVLDEVALNEGLASVVAELGQITILLNTVGGFAMGHPVHETEPSQLDHLWQLNVSTLTNICRAVVPGMLEVGRGKVVNVAAAAALQGQPLMGGYCAAKGAVVTLTESMSAELKEKGINVNCVLPSIIDTPENRQAMPDADFTRWVAPERLARVMWFLASEDASPIHGAAIPVRGLS